jgi:5'-nucleotidase
MVLHTNDLHSQIEPVSVNNAGGFARLAWQIEELREDNSDKVLLLNAGDVWQGTPYFNFFDGKLEFDFLDRMKYDATTLGNHEFDKGIEHLAKMLKNLKTPVVLSNYDVSDSSLKGLIKPYLIIRRNGVKIGVIALLIDLKGLTMDSSFEGMKYRNATVSANEMATFLKEKKKCDIIICLSHLGFEADKRLTQQSENIDLIVGGHSHTLLPKGEKIKNVNGKEIEIVQTQNSGMFLGKVEIHLEKN